MQAQSAARGRVWFEGELRNVGWKLNADHDLPIQGAQGLIRLEKGVFTFTELKGNYGQSRFTDVDGTYQLAPESKGNLDIRAVGELDLAELREQMKLGMLPSQVASSLEELGGKGRIDLSLQRSGDSAPQFEGKVTLDNARLRFDDDFSHGNQEEISPGLAAEIRTEKLSALLSNSPVQHQLSLGNYASDGRRLRPPGRINGRQSWNRQPSAPFHGIF